MVTQSEEYGVLTAVVAVLSYLLSAPLPEEWHIALTAIATGITAYIGAVKAGVAAVAAAKA